MRNSINAWTNGRRCAGLVLAGATMLVAGSALAADDWPARPVTIVVPWAAGGPVDVAGRIIAEALQSDLGSAFVVENKGGASSAIGTDYVARQPADGYTFLLSGNNLAITKWTNPSITYDPMADFEHIGLIGLYSGGVFVGSATPYQDFDQMVATIRAEPGKVNYTSPGVGSGNHIIFEYLKAAQGLDTVHVPFSGSGPALQAVLAGEVDAIISGLPGTEGHVAAGSLRLLGITGATRAEAFPDTPTFAELGYPELNVEYFVSLSAPDGIPTPVRDKVAAALDRALASETVQARLDAVGIRATARSGEAFTAFVGETMDWWREAVQSAGIAVGN